MTLEPTDDVWVYQFAEDQTNDEFLRVWGSDGTAVGTSFEGHLSFSYSCLKFSLPKDLPGQTLATAKLVLTHTPEAGWTEKDSKANPVEARMLPTDWNESNWSYENAKKIHPTASASEIFGTGSAAPAPDDQPFVIEVNLMEKDGVFAKVFNEASNDPSRILAMALTSKLEANGENSVYKFYSKSNEAKLRPKLVLTFSASRRS